MLRIRNPLLADIFERLGYMERRGSGFGKIIWSYEAQVNYKEGKRPYFRSDRTQFTVILPNLNYDVTQGVTQGVTQDVTQDDIEAKILGLVRENNKISTETIAQKLSISSRTVKRRIDNMPNLKFVGSGYSGHWEIVEE